MPRSTNAVASRARRKKVLKMAKGYFGARKNVYTVAKNAVEKGLQYAYIGRKLRKRQFRSLWIMRINAAARQHGMSYSKFMGQLSKSGIELNRKVLADLAMNHPEAFKAVVNKIK
ncbi:MAG: 50S ribosomal protein L20 [Euryarchaeota archaeon]|nr:50S ribosomal protein L20 [Euryarchaeota archaeon]|tara:strand:+ start:249 stop:593 length:345 start_codon:yes stop_codon:yes gene_type:complete